MANEFKVKNGLIVDQGGALITGSSTLSGSVSVTGSTSITGSFTASLQSGYAWVGDSTGISRPVATSSFTTSLPGGLVSGSSQIDITQTTGYTIFSQSLAGTDFSQSISILISSQSAVGAFQSASVYSSSNATVNDGQNIRLNSLENITASSANSLTALNLSTASLNSKTGSYAITGSNIFQGNQTINGTLNVTNIVVTTITASTEYSSGSNVFGSSSANTHDFTGSVRITGSTTITGGNFQLSGTSLLNWDGNDGLYVDKTQIYRNYFGNTFGRIQFLNAITAYGGTQVGLVLAAFNSNVNGLYIIRNVGSSANNIYIGNNTTANANMSASFHVDTPGQGVLLPRMSSAQRTGSMLVPPQGIIVYDTGSMAEGFYYYSSGSIKSWTRLLNDTGSQIISGSIETTGGITGSLLSTNGVVSGSSQITISSTTGYTAFSQSFAGTDQSASVLTLIASQSAYGAFQSASAYSSSASTVDNVQNVRLNAIETFSASVFGTNQFTASIAATNTFTQSAGLRLNALETISASTITRLGNLETFTGSFSASNSQTDATQSFLTLIASQSAYGAFQSASAYSSSAGTTDNGQNLRLNAIETFSASVFGTNQFTASIAATNTFTQSAGLRLNALETISASTITRLGNLETFTGSFSASNSQTDATQSFLTLIASQSAYGAFQSASAYSSSAGTTDNGQNLRLNSIETFSASVFGTNQFTASIVATNTFTQSAGLRLNSIETFTSSFSASNSQTDATQSFLILIASQSAYGAFQSASAYSSSASTVDNVQNVRLNSLETYTGSSANSLTALNLSTASLNSKTGSYAITGSNTFVGNQTISGNLVITGSLAVGTSSLGASENTLTLGARDTGGEGGQLGLNAPGGTYTSASMIDNYQNLTRLLRGTNTGSDAVVTQWDMHTKQVQFPAYSSTTAFTGTTLVGLLGFDSNGRILTTTTGSGGGGTAVNILNNTDNYILTATGTANTINGEGNLQFNGSTLSVTGNLTATSITSSGAFIAQANGAMYFRGGDDAELWDINVANTVGLYGQQDQTVGSLKLGNNGGILSGWSGSIGVGTILPNSGSLHVNGNIFATSITGSIRSTNGIVSGSSQIDITSTTNYTSFSQSLYGTDSTQSVQINSLNTFTASANNSLTALNLSTASLNSKTGSYAITASNIFTANQTITGSLFVSGSINTPSITGSLLGTASIANSASIAINAVTSSYPFTISGSVLYTVAPYSYDVTGQQLANTIHIGENAGSGSFGFYASNAIYIGKNSGYNAYNRNGVHIGIGAGSNTSPSNGFAVFIGNNAGSGSSNTDYSVMIGPDAGLQSNVFQSTFVGYGAGYQSTAPNSVAIGFFAGATVTGSAQRSIYIGSDAGGRAHNADYSTFIGLSSGYRAYNANYSTFLGVNTGADAIGANNSFFVGYNAGTNAISASYSTIIGYNSGYTSTNNLLGTNNIIIGTKVTLENGRRDSINIGGIIFGTGSYYNTSVGSAFSGSANGRIGINVVNPQYTLDVSGNGNFTNGITVTGSSIITSITGSLLSTNGVVSGSSQITLSSTTGYTSFSQSFAGTNQSSSILTLIASQSAYGAFQSASSYSSSNATTDNLQNIRLDSIEFKTGSFAITGSNTFQGNQTINGTLTVTNIVSTTITSSTEYSSGSNRFGSSSANIQEFTGSVRMSGSLNVADTGSFPYVTLTSPAPEIKLIGTTTNTGVKGIYFYNNALSAWVKSTPIGSSDTGNLQLGAYGVPAITINGTIAGLTSISASTTMSAPVYDSSTPINSGEHAYNFNSGERAVRIVSTKLGSFGRGNFKLMVRSAGTSTDAVDSDTVIYIPGTNTNVSINAGVTDLGYSLGVSGSGKFTNGLNITGSSVLSGSSTTITGSLLVSGSINTPSITGSLLGTASYYQLVTGNSGTDVNIVTTLSGSILNIPDAGSSARGLITTGTQTIAGSKTFTGTTQVGAFQNDGTGFGIIFGTSFLGAGAESLGGTSITQLNRQYSIINTTTAAGTAGSAFMGLRIKATDAAGSSGIAYAGIGVGIRLGSLGTGQFTNAATLYVEGAYTGTAITNSYAVWINSGSTRLDGDLLVSGSNVKIQLTGSLLVSGSMTASLQSGYALVGGPNNTSIAVATSSFGGAVNSFGTIAVAGQSNVVADQTNDILTLTAGTNITITTDATTDTITINASGGSATAGGSNKSIQFNDSTALSGSSRFNFDKTINKVSLTGSMLVSGSGGGPTLQLFGSGSTVFSISGSSTELFKITDDTTSSTLVSIGGDFGDIFVVTTSSVNITGSLIVSASSNVPTFQVFGSGSTVFSVSGSNSELFKVVDSPNSSTLAVISSGSLNVLTVTTSSVNLSASFSASLQSGYAWVGDANGYSRAVQTASLSVATASFYQIVTGTAGSDVNVVVSPSGSVFNIPDASSSNRGLMTTGTQTFTGTKTFLSYTALDSVTFGNTNGSIYSLSTAGYTSIPGNGNFSLSGSNDISVRLGFPGVNSGTLSTGYNASAYAFRGGTIITAATGIHPIVASVSVRPNIINTGGANVANAATLYIEGPASGSATIVNNYTLWASGSTRIDGATTISGSLQVSGSMTASLQSGYAWVGDANGYSRAVQTASFAGTSGYSVTTQTSNYTETITSGKKIILCNTNAGGFTVTLPSAVGNTAELVIKKILGSAPVIVDGAGSELIDDGLTATLYSQYESITLISDNTEWYII